MFSYAGLRNWLLLIILPVFFIPLFSQAGLIIYPGVEEEVKPGGPVQIEVCTTPARYASDGKVIAATGCTRIDAVISTVKDQYIATDGTIYERDCLSAPEGAKNAAGLIITPSTPCDFYKVEASDTDTPVKTIVSRGLVPCGGTGQPPCQTCHVVQLVNEVVAWLIGILGLIATIMIIYAGFLLVTSGGNSSAKEKAKSLMTNLIIGYVIVLAAWLLVDYGVKAMLKEGAFGPWNEITCVAQPVARWSDPVTALAGISGWSDAGTAGSMQATCDIVSPGGSFAAPVYDCSVQMAECVSIVGTATVSSGGNMVTCAPALGGSIGSNGLGQCNTNNVACSVAALQGAGLTLQQANIMSCIAMTESSGIPSTPPHNETNPGSGSTACGTFQITRTTWKGYAPSGSCQDFRSNCQKASCNIQVMTNLVRSNGYRDWTCPGCNIKAQRCVAQYGG